MGEHAQKPFLLVCYLCGKQQFASGVGADAAKGAWLEPDSPESRAIMEPLLKNDDSLRFSYSCCQDCLHYFERVTDQQQWRKAVRSSQTAGVQEANASSPS